MRSSIRSRTSLPFLNDLPAWILGLCSTTFQFRRGGPSGSCNGSLVSFAQGRNRFRYPGYSNTDFSMRIWDNGCGIDPQVLRTGRDGHWGLAGMRERAAKIGGLLNISSSATAGTEVQLSIPSSVAFQSSSADHSLKG